MPSYFEANDAHYQVNQETLTPDRAPQFNEDNSGCGCRCRTREADAEGDGGSNDEDSASTLVPSDIDSDSGFPDSSDGPERHVSVGLFQPSPLQGARYPSDGRTRIGMFENGVEGFQPSQLVVDMEPIRPHRMPPLYEERADSMSNGYGSEDRSVVASDTRSPSRMSPGPGIGGWIGEDLQPQELHFKEYHFLVRPLRLTPQRRYCRGLVTSHMVVPDEDFYGQVG